MGSFWVDLRYGARRLAGNPAFAGVAILTLALGIGATSTIFSVVNAVLLRPLPFHSPAGLIAITQVSRDTQAGGVPVSFTKLQAIQEQALGLEGLAAYYTLDLSLGGNGQPETVPAARVSGNLFELLGATPSRGRGFLAEELAAGGSDVAVISDGLWRRRFGSDPSVVGKTIRLDGKNVTVVAILPRTFRFPLESPEPQVWLPRVFEPDFLTPVQVHSGASYLSVLGRLRDGETLAHAQADLDIVDARYAQRYGSFVDATRFRLQAASLADSFAGPSRRPLMVLLAAVGFVLLIVCANVASLQLARASSRAREMAVRKALGASRSRLVRQLLIESLGLSLLGGALGVLVALWVSPLVQRVSASALPRLEEARVNGPVLLFALGVCCATAIAFGLAPALYASRGHLRSDLGQGARGSSDGAARTRLRVLFVAEAAVALVLVTGAGLLVRSLGRLLGVDPGFRAQGVMTIPVEVPVLRYGEPARQAEFFAQLLQRLGGLPGVKAVAATSYLPLAGAYRFVFFCPEGRVCQGIGKDPVIAQSQVTPGYFETLRMRILRGRSFEARDTADSAPVVIVNETTVRRYWPNADPIGKHLANSRDRVQREVVGVVADVSLRALGAPKADQMYLPLSQSPWPAMTLILRGEADARPLVDEARREIAGLDPDIAISGARPMDEVVSGSLAQPRLIAWVVATFAALSLLLASIGIYGVMTYSVVERTREFGVRMALGASPREILRLVLREGMSLTLGGVGLGYLCSLVLTRLLAGLLFGVDAADPLTFATAGIVLTITAFLACYLPARRGMRLQPIRALRHD